MLVYDFMLSDTFDLVIENGDFKVVESTRQHQLCLLMAAKGEYKQNPTIGVELNKQILNDVGKDELESAITKEFEDDGMKIRALKAKDFEHIDIEATY